MNAQAPDCTIGRPIDFTRYTQEDAPAGSLDLLNAVEAKFGFIPNVLREMAEAPAALEGTVRLLGLMDKSSLSAVEQWVVLLVVAFQNTSDYCVAANSAVARMSSVPAEVIDGIRRGEPLPAPRLEALRRFAAEMVRARGRVCEETTQRFFGAGFTKAQALEVVLGIATETMASYTDRLSETPVDEQFQEYAWTQPETAPAATD